MKNIQQEIKMNVRGEMTDKDCKHRDLTAMITAIKIILRSIFIAPESTVPAQSTSQLFHHRISLQYCSNIKQHCPLNIQRKTARERERQTDRQRQRETERQRQRDRERERDRDSQTDRDRETE